MAPALSPRRALPALLAALVLSGILLASSGCGEPPPAAAALRPNLILISLDTLRPDHLGAYGYPIETSPALDRFARRGLVFEEAIAPAPWTAPSHAAMLTGLYPNRHGIKTHKHKLSDRVTLRRGHREQQVLGRDVLVTEPIAFAVRVLENLL